MKKIPFKIVINNPCSEDFDSMKDTACGKFCDLCKKEVYDLRHLSDNDVYKIIQENNGNVCAQLSQDQYENGFLYSELEKNRNYPWMKYAASILFIGGLASTSFSQDKISHLTPIKTEHSINNSTTTKEDSIKVNGVIINAVTNKPLTYSMLVELKVGDKSLVKTNSTTIGEFNSTISKIDNFDEMNLVLHYLSDKNDTIQVSKEQVLIKKIEGGYQITVRVPILSEDYKLSKMKRNSVRIEGTLGMVSVIYLDNIPKSCYIDGVKVTSFPHDGREKPVTIPGGTPANYEHNVEDANKVLYR